MNSHDLPTKTSNAEMHADLAAAIAPAITAITTTTSAINSSEPLPTSVNECIKLAKRALQEVIIPRQDDIEQDLTWIKEISEGVQPGNANIKRITGLATLQPEIPTGGF